MAFLVVAGNTISVEVDSVTTEFLNVNERLVTALATNTTNQRNIVRRKWNLTTTPMTLTAANTLGAVINDVDLAVYGTLINRISTNTLSCLGEVTNIMVDRHAKEMQAVIEFSLTENGTAGTMTWHDYTAPEPEAYDDGWEAPGATGYKVVAYCFGNPVSVDPTIMTHINYAFGTITGTSVVVATPAHLTTMVGLKATNPTLKCILSVGGWGVDFDGVYDTDAHRTSFAASCATWVSDYDLDGIDIDCEYPSNATEKGYFTLLMQKIKDTLPGGKLVTIATPGGTTVNNIFDLAALEVICDYIMVMNYDFDRTGAAHNANLYDTAWTSYSGHDTMEYYMTIITDPTKLIFGLPIYGMIWDGVGDGVNKTYDQLVAGYLDLGGYAVSWDNTAKASYLWKDAAFKGTYESTDAIDEKSDYVIAHGYGGIMYWDYLQDSAQVLTGRIYSNLRGA